MTARDHTRNYTILTDAIKNPLSRRANEDKRQTDLLLKAWEERGKVYGYR